MDYISMSEFNRLVFGFSRFFAGFIGNQYFFKPKHDYTLDHWFSGLTAGTVWV